MTEKFLLRIMQKSSAKILIKILRKLQSELC